MKLAAPIILGLALPSLLDAGTPAEATKPAPAAVRPKVRYVVAQRAAAPRVKYSVQQRTVAAPKAAPRMQVTPGVRPAAPKRRGSRWGRIGGFFRRVGNGIRNGVGRAARGVAPNASQRQRQGQGTRR